MQIELKMFPLVAVGVQTAPTYPAETLGDQPKDRKMSLPRVIRREVGGGVEGEFGVLVVDGRGVVVRAIEEDPSGQIT